MATILVFALIASVARPDYDVSIMCFGLVLTMFHESKSRPLAFFTAIVSFTVLLDMAWLAAYSGTWLDAKEFWNMNDEAYEKGSHVAAAVFTIINFLLKLPLVVLMVIHVNKHWRSDQGSGFFLRMGGATMTNSGSGTFYNSTLDGTGPSWEGFFCLFVPLAGLVSSFFF